MDSITQAALGGAVGEAVLGALPDLDVFLNPLMTHVEQLSFHRGSSHSILFALIAAPLIGVGLSRLHQKSEVP